jgi:chromosomal replication initiation ATPase DnaA
MKAHTLLVTAIRLIIEEQLDAALADRGLAAITVAKSRDSWRAKVILTVLTIVAEEYGITPASIRTAGRPQPQALARQICLTLLRDIDGIDRTEAVAAVGLSDASTANAAYRRVAALEATDPEFAGRLAQIRQKFTAALAPR